MANLGKKDQQSEGFRNHVNFDIALNSKTKSRLEING